MLAGAPAVQTVPTPGAVITQTGVELVWALTTETARRAKATRFLNMMGVRLTRMSEKKVGDEPRIVFGSFLYCDLIRRNGNWMHVG